MKISLVIPAYNESKIIEDTARAALEYLSGRFDGFELIIVDDGSTDDTARLVRGLDAARVRILSYPDNRGKGCAVRTGALAAFGELVFYTDADLAYGLGHIEHAARLLETGADIVIGSRRLLSDGYGEYPPIRLLASRLFSFASRAFSGMRYDTQCGFKGFRKPVSDEIFSKCTADGFSFDFEVMLLAEGRFEVREIPVKIINHRESKVRLLRDSLRMFREILRIRGKVKRLRHGQN